MKIATLTIIALAWVLVSGLYYAFFKDDYIDRISTVRMLKEFGKKPDFEDIAYFVLVPIGFVFFTLLFATMFAGTLINC